MDMSQFFYYPITGGSWLYFSATVQVCALALHALLLDQLQSVYCSHLK